VITYFLISFIVVILIVQFVFALEPYTILKGNPPLKEELKNFPDNKISDISFECDIDIFGLAKLFIKEGGLKT